MPFFLDAVQFPLDNVGIGGATLVEQRLTILHATCTGPGVAVCAFFINQWRIRSVLYMSLTRLEDCECSGCSWWRKLRLKWSEHTISVAQYSASRLFVVVGPSCRFRRFRRGNVGSLFLITSRLVPSVPIASSELFSLSISSPVKLSLLMPSASSSMRFDEAFHNHWIYIRIAAHGGSAELLPLFNAHSMALQAGPGAHVRSSATVGCVSSLQSTHRPTCQAIHGKTQCRPNRPISTEMLHSLHQILLFCYSTCPDHPPCADAIA